MVVSRLYRDSGGRLPRNVPDSKVLEATGNLHHRITDAIGTDPKVIFEDRAAFDGADDMLNKYPTAADLSICRLLLVGYGLSIGVLVRHRDGHIWKRKPEIAEILEQFTANGQRIGRHICHQLLVGAAFVCIAQKPDPRRPVGQEHVFHRVVVRLAAPVVFLFTWVLGARDGALGAVVKKGDAAVAQHPDHRSGSAARRASGWVPAPLHAVPCAAPESGCSTRCSRSTGSGQRWHRDRLDAARAWSSSLRTTADLRASGAGSWCTP